MKRNFKFSKELIRTSKLRSYFLYIKQKNILSTSHTVCSAYNEFHKFHKFFFYTYVHAYH